MLEYDTFQLARTARLQAQGLELIYWYFTQPEPGETGREHEGVEKKEACDGEVSSQVMLGAASPPATQGVPQFVFKRRFSNLSRYKLQISEEQI